MDVRHITTACEEAIAREKANRGVAAVVNDVYFDRRVAGIDKARLVAYKAGYRRWDHIRRWATVVQAHGG